MVPAKSGGRLAAPEWLSPAKDLNWRCFSFTPLAAIVIESGLWSPTCSYMLFHLPCSVWTLSACLPPCLPWGLCPAALLWRKKKILKKLKLLLEKDGAWRIPAWEGNVSELISPGEEERRKLFLLLAKVVFSLEFFSQSFQASIKNPTA